MTIASVHIRKKCDFLVLMLFMPIAYLR